jgi:hypothetical protein
MIWVMQDNYSRWRWFRKDEGGTSTNDGGPFALRAEAVADARRYFPEEALVTDGESYDTNQFVPLPIVDRQREAAAGGYVAP